MSFIHVLFSSSYFFFYFVTCMAFNPSKSVYFNTLKMKLQFYINICISSVCMVNYQFRITVNHLQSTHQSSGANSGTVVVVCIKVKSCVIWIVLCPACKRYSISGYWKNMSTSPNFRNISTSSALYIPFSKEIKLSFHSFFITKLLCLLLRNTVLNGWRSVVDFSRLFFSEFSMSWEY